MSVEPEEPCTGWQIERSMITARDGSFAALGQLLDHYRDYLLRVAAEELPRDLVGKLGASDLVQETFLQATKGFPRFQGHTEAELRRWLRQILINNVLDAQKHFHANKRSIDQEQRLPLAQDSDVRAGGELACAGQRPSAVAASAEERAAVERALATLPPDYRRVIELRSFDDRSFEEIGRELNRSAEAARRLWSRAVQRLALELDK